MCVCVGGVSTNQRMYFYLLMRDEELKAEKVGAKDNRNPFLAKRLKSVGIVSDRCFPWQHISNSPLVLWY